MNNRGFYWNLGGGGLWFVPVFIGVMLILFGVLIFLIPNLLEYFVASALLLAGGSLVGVGWQWRTRATYRRLNRDGNEPDLFS